MTFGCHMRFWLYIIYASASSHGSGELVDLYSLTRALLHYTDQVLFVLMLYIQMNNFSVMAALFPIFLGLTCTKQQMKCLAQGHNTVTPAAVSESRTSNHSIPILTLYHQ